MCDLSFISLYRQDSGEFMPFRTNQKSAFNHEINVVDAPAESTHSAVLLYRRRLAALLVAPIRNQQTAVAEQKPAAQWRSQHRPSVCGQKSLLAHRSCSDFTDSGCEILVSFHGSDLTAGPTRSSRCSTSIRNSHRLFLFLS